MRFLLIGDFVEGTWDGVVEAWCDHAGELCLCLTPDEEAAEAYLVVARHPEEVLEALPAAHRPLPVVWVNDRDGAVRTFAAAGEAWRALAEACLLSPAPSREETT